MPPHIVIFFSFKLQQWGNLIKKHKINTFIKIVKYKIFFLKLKFKKKGFESFLDNLY